MNSMDDVNRQYRQGLIGQLGITFLEAESGCVRASMPVDERTVQPFGLLSGGASLALAESIAGHGSRLLCAEGCIPCGVQISGNHLAAARAGQMVVGVGTLLYGGSGVHVWNVDISNEDGRLISTARVVNRILCPRETTLQHSEWTDACMEAPEGL